MRKFWRTKHEPTSRFGGLLRQDSCRFEPWIRLDVSSLQGPQKNEGKRNKDCCNFPNDKLSTETGTVQNTILPSFGTVSAATEALNSMFKDEVFSRPKPIPMMEYLIGLPTGEETDVLIADFFAGSGTTGHAVINLNREDSRNRKYVLVEIGHYFQTVLLPRLKKAVYSKKWENGKPKDREGVSQFFRYVRLESYEDTLDSLTVKPRKDLFTKEENKRIIEDYQLRYALGEETAESASLVGKDFIDPFSYTLSVVRDGVRRDVNVDLVETFNFLLGLRLTSRRPIGGVLIITGVNSKGDNCLILWRNLKKMGASKLDKWFSKHRKDFGDDLNLIYVNGDHTLNALKKSTDKWEAITTEPVFKELMFEGIA